MLEIPEVQRLKAKVLSEMPAAEVDIVHNQLECESLV